MQFVCGETFESGELKNPFISPHKCLSIYFPDKQEMLFHALKTASTSTLNLIWEKPLVQQPLWVAGAEYWYPALKDVYEASL